MQNIFEVRWLEDWFTDQCDGLWEHEFGISISTLDNPGWKVSISLAGTRLSGKIMEEKRINYDHDEDWYMVRISNNIFEGAGGPGRLSAMLLEFKSFVEKNAS